MSNDPRLLQLDTRDNVLVVTARVRAGETLVVDGRDIAVPADLPLGHKVAQRPMAVGEAVVKYGAPIGFASAPIGAGEHVHVHNIRSGYTPTYHLDAAKARYGSEP